MMHLFKVDFGHCSGLLKTSRPGVLRLLMGPMSVLLASRVRLCLLRVENNSLQIHCWRNVRQSEMGQARLLQDRNLAKCLCLTHSRHFECWLALLSIFKSHRYVTFIPLTRASSAVALDDLKGPYLLDRALQSAIWDSLTFWTGSHVTYKGVIETSRSAELRLSQQSETSWRSNESKITAFNFGAWGSWVREMEARNSFVAKKVLIDTFCPILTT